LSEFLVEQMDSPSDLKRPLLGRRKCRWSAPVPLDRFRTIAQATNTTINDVLLACVAAAVRPRLGMTDAQLDDAILHAAVPVDIRAQLPEGIKPGDGKPGNCFGTVFVPLPVDGESALERLFRIKHETRKLKKSWQPGIAWGLTACASLLPEAGRRPLADLFFRKASAVVSNVPGTSETRYLAGCAITEQMFWVPQAGDIGLGVSIVSYAGQVQFGVVADEAVMPDPQSFLSDSIAELGQFGWLYDYWTTPVSADLPLAVDHFRYFAGCIRAQEDTSSAIDNNTVAYHYHEPLGVVGQIIPWNFPLLMAVWKLAPCLAAGN